MCTAVYTSIVRAGNDSEVASTLRSCLRTYGWLSLPFLIGCLTVPHDLLFRIIPTRYAATPRVLGVLAVVGVMIGAINVAMTAHQARRRYRSATLIIGAGVALQCGLLLGIGRTGHVMWFAVSGAAVVLTTLASVLLDARHWLRGSIGAPSRYVVVTAALAAVVFVPATPPWLWTLEITALTATCVRSALSDRPGTPRHRRRRRLVV
jgi:O-antigen/teichoic acid export membrane protein